MPPHVFVAGAVQVRVSDCHDSVIYLLAPLQVRSHRRGLLQHSATISLHRAGGAPTYAPPPLTHTHTFARHMTSN